MKLLKNLPFLYTIIVLINPVLNKFGIFYIHYFLLVLGCGISVPKYLNKYGPNFKREDRGILTLFLVVIFVVIINVLSSLSEFLLIVNSLSYFLIFPLFWFFYMRQKEVDILKLSKLIVYIGLINGVVCLVQFFVSPTLFGLYSYSTYQIDVIGYRPGALLGSPQVYGLFVIMSSIIAFEIYLKTKQKLFLIYGFALIPLSLLSGNKSVMVCILLYVLLRLFFFMPLKRLLSWRSFLIVGMVCISFFILSNLASSNTTIFKNIERLTLVFSDRKSVTQDEDEGRIRIYNEFFKSYTSDFYKIIIGGGIGSYSSLARNSDGGEPNQGATESYLLEVLGEYGIIIFVLYLNIWFVSLVKAKRANYGFNLFSINLILGISLLFVHAFAHPIFFLFWPLILFPIVKLKTNNISNLLKVRYTELT